MIGVFLAHEFEKVFKQFWLWYKVLISWGPGCPEPKSCSWEKVYGSKFSVVVQQNLLKPGIAQGKVTKRFFTHANVVA